MNPNVNERVAALEERMDNLSENFAEAKEDRRELLKRLGEVERKIYMAVGAVAAVQVVLAVALKWLGK